MCSSRLLAASSHQLMVCLARSGVCSRSTAKVYPSISVGWSQPNWTTKGLLRMMCSPSVSVSMAPILGWCSWNSFTIRLAARFV